jgi:hypothetical protein|eukprot:CAMPEP_0181203106 /NCGR_PEP_ID=MMETSP1096-20121128/19206_1 /TAXON_ID=156174 ORGANISM="Chrysochromulina ericina, Strain CCMP281" /NCGR_SAMPLE_ID=MMETSP1096 /ASSEMBLY_ACC=CAM_ASM_000453 /LENGTH=101 /DNA_ID=CAMNT_0023293679 /DNA_START=427 /DNA_END=732 /DNA_ORIENTATION=+
MAYSPWPCDVTVRTCVLGCGKDSTQGISHIHRNVTIEQLDVTHCAVVPTVGSTSAPTSQFPSNARISDSKGVAPSMIATVETAIYVAEYDLDYSSGSYCRR